MWPLLASIAIVPTLLTAHWQVSALPAPAVITIPLPMTTIVISVPTTFPGVPDLSGTATSTTSSSNGGSSSSNGHSASSTTGGHPSSSSGGIHSTSSASIVTITTTIPSAAPTPPFTPQGGWDTNNSDPYYHPMSNFDFQSLNLALNQEYLELDVFNYGLAKFNRQEFESAGLNEEDRYLIKFMADQEVGHAQLLTNILGEHAAKPCQYQYPFQTVREFIDFCQKITRVGESGVLGFAQHLMSRPAGTLLLQTVTTESRQQMIFRQFEGLFPMPVWFETAITQSMAWSWIAEYITECPSTNPFIEWQNFPALNVTNNPNATALYNTSQTGNITVPSITHNRSHPLSSPGDQIYFTWDAPGKIVGYNDSYITNTTAGTPKFAAWISQLNMTYTPLYNITDNSASTMQPSGGVLYNDTAPLINGTVFIVITDSDANITSYNLSAINTHIVAGPALYQSG